MKTITIGDQLLDELFPDFTKQLVRDWTRVHVDDLAAEVFGAIDRRAAPWPPRPSPVPARYPGRRTAKVRGA